MAVTKKIDNVRLPMDWVEVDLGGFNAFYLIGIKEAKAVTDTIDPKDIKVINFEIGIESGIDKQYLTIGRVTLNFREETSSNKSLNDITAFTRCTGYPDKFFMKPVEVITDKGLVKEGQTSKDKNFNTVKLF